MASEAVAEDMAERSRKKNNEVATGRSKLTGEIILGESVNQYD